MADTIPKYKLKAGRKAVAQLVCAVASADLARTGTLPPAEREAAARALAELHQSMLEQSSQVSVLDLHDTAQELSQAAATFVGVYSVLLRELSALASAPGKGHHEQEDSSSGTKLLDANGVRSGGTPSSNYSSSTAAAASSSEGHGAGPSSGDCVPLLVDSSAVVANSLWAMLSANTADSDVRQLYASSSCASQTRAATSVDTRKGHVRSCAVPMVAALLRSDALPALSRLLSAEAQRGPARALLNPLQLATCLKPLSALLMAAHTLPDVLLPADPTSLREPHHPSPIKPSTATTSTAPAPSCVPPTPEPTPGAISPPAACPSAATPASAGLGKSPANCPTPHAAGSEYESSVAVRLAHLGHSPSSSTASPAPSPAQPHQPQTLGPAVLCAVADSGVLEAACRAVVGAVEQGSGGRQQQQQEGARSPSDHRSALLHVLLAVLLQVHDAGFRSADRDRSLQGRHLGRILAGPRAQYVLAAHAVSQLHAVDGGTTYGLPYDSLMPPVREAGKTELSCKWLLTGVTWWANVCRSGGLPPLQPLSPRGLFELCLREAEVAADCWRRRNGLAAAATAAAAGVAGRAGSGTRSRGFAGGTNSRRSRSKEQESRAVAATCSTGVYSRLASLDIDLCPALASLALDCSRCIVDSCCSAGASQGGRGVDRGGSGSGEGGVGKSGMGIGSGGSREGESSGGRSREDGGVGVGNKEGATVAEDGPPGDSSCAVWGSENPAAWLGDGGPLARRWWRAAVAAVHCAVDQAAAVGLQVAVDGLLGPSLAVPVSDPGPALPAAPPAAVSAALDAGCLPCLERTLRTCFRVCNTPNEAVDVCRDVIGGHANTSWPLLLAFGDEREAAAFLATAAKVARRACQERARPGGDRKACATVMAWLEGMMSYLWRAADHVAERVAVERGSGEGQPSNAVQELGREIATTGDSGGGDGSGGGCDADRSSRLGGDDGGMSDVSTSGPTSRGGGVHNSARTGGRASSDSGGGANQGSRSNACSDGVGGGGSSRSGGGSTDGSAAPPTSGPSGYGSAAAAAATATSSDAGSLSPPEQQRMRLLSFALPLWLPLWLDLAVAMVADKRLTKWWRGDVHRAFELLDLVQHLCVDALEKQDLRAAESWRSIIVKSGDEVEGLVDGCRRMLEREAATAGLLSSGGTGARVREEDEITAEQLYKRMGKVQKTTMLVHAEWQEAMIAQGEVEGGWQGLWPVVGLGLLSPPCNARQLLPCCSNPRCAGLAGDSEASVVLRRCGGACGGAAAYCCAACQRAHWAAGHREECTGKRRGGERAEAEAEAAGTSKKN